MEIRVSICPYNLKGDILKDFLTSSKSCIQDITVTHSGQLLYTDDNNRSANIVSITQKDTLVKLNEWRVQCFILGLPCCHDE